MKANTTNKQVSVRNPYVTFAYTKHSVVKQRNVMGLSFAVHAHAGHLVRVTKDALGCLGNDLASFCSFIRFGEILENMALISVAPSDVAWL